MAAVGNVSSDTCRTKTDLSVHLGSLISILMTLLIVRIQNMLSEVFNLSSSDWPISNLRDIWLLLLSYLLKFLYLMQKM